MAQGDSWPNSDMTVFGGRNDMMYQVQDAYSVTMCLYFVILIFLGPIFAVQLFLVVISTKFAETKESLKALEQSKVDAAIARPPDQESQHGNGHEDGHDREIEGTDRAVATAAERKDGTRGNGSSAPVGVPETTPANGDETKDGTTGDVHVPRQEESFMDESMIGERIHEDRSSNIDRPGGDDSQPGGERKKKRRRKRTPRQLFFYKMSLLAKSEIMSNAVLSVIIANTMMMAINHDCDVCTQDYCRTFKGTLEVFNVVFALIFVVEAVIKILGLGLWEYFTNKMCLFDLAIVIVSCVEIESVLQVNKCLTQDISGMSEQNACIALESCDGGGGGVTVLRTFRLVRIVKLLRAFPEVQKQVKIVVGILGSVAALIALIFIFLLIFCILGMNVFGGAIVSEWDPDNVALGAAVYISLPGDTLPDILRGRYAHVVDVDPFNHSSQPWQVEIKWGKELYKELNLDEDGRTWAQVQDTAGVGVPKIVEIVPRMHFDDLLHAAMTTFQVLTVANWNDDLYDTAGSTGASAAIYFYCIIVIGNWMLLNLFIAILIQGFAEQKATLLEENLKKMQAQFYERLGGLTQTELAEKMAELFKKMDRDNSGVIDKRELQKMLEELEVHLTEKELTQLFRQYDQDGSGEIDFSEFLSLVKDLLQKALQFVNGVSAGTDVEESQKEDTSAFDQAQKLHDERRRSTLVQNVEDKVPRSLFCLEKNNPIRKAAGLLANWKWFDRFILLCIFMSSISLAAEHPGIGDKSLQREVMTNVDLFLNAAFILECAAKVRC